MAQIEVSCAVVAWGASFVATKIVLREVAPVTVVWLRLAMGIVVLGAAVVARRELAPASRRELWELTLLGLLGITFHQWLQSTGMVTARATTTAWIVATIPIFMAVLGWLFLRERLTWAQASGILLAGLGVLLVITGGDWSILLAGGPDAGGDLLVLLSAPNWAVFSVLSRRMLRRRPATWLIFHVMTIGWLFTTILFLAGPGVADLARLSSGGWASVGFLGIVCSGFAYIFWYDALEALPVAKTGAFIYLEPLVTVALAAIVLGERMLLASLFGGGTILLGVWLVNRPTRARRAKGESKSGEPR